MKKAKKYLLLIVFIIPTLIAFFYNKIATNAATEGSVTNAYGYKISLVRYTGSGTPERMGKPILVYHPDMMGEPTFVKSDPAGLPNSHDELMNSGGSYNLNQLWDDSNYDYRTEVISPGDDENGEAEWSEIDAWNENAGLYPRGAMDNPYLYKFLFDLGIMRFLE